MSEIGYPLNSIEIDGDRSPGRDTLTLIWEIARARPWPLLAMIAFVLIGNARAGIYIAAQGALVDALFMSDGRKALTWATAWIVTNAVEEAYWATKPWLVALIYDDAVYRFQKRVMERAASVPLIAFDQGTFFARLQRANDNIGGKLSNLLMFLVDSLEDVILGASIGVALWFVSPWLVPILILGSVPAIILDYRVADTVQQARKKHASSDQLLRRLESILSDRDAGAELRLFGNGADMVSRWRAARNARANDVLGAERRRSRFAISGESIRGLAIALCIAVALWSIIDQNHSIGTWVVVTMGLDSMSRIIRSIAQISRQSREQVAYASDLFAFEEHANAIVSAEQQTRNAISAGVQSCTQGRHVSKGALEIDLHDVSFVYPSSSEPVVRDFSVSIEPGETIAIVGENGAGKSTLFRLISGLYLPTSGSVCIDGIDTRDTAFRTVLPRIGAVFQDHMAFQLTARDNVGFGDVGHEYDQVRLDAAVRGAGIEDLIASLTNGYDTWLGRQFGERDLSGGQWQRVALSRAFYRNADLLILDEPTAALDPKAEQALFERFALLVADRTAIMISHRLASARFADRILVMDGGHLIEQGTHDSLMLSGGAYAKMFAGQAEWYR